MSWRKVSGRRVRPNGWGEGCVFSQSHPDLLDGRREAASWARIVKGMPQSTVVQATIRGENGIGLVANQNHTRSFEEVMRAAVDKHLESGSAITDFGPMWFSS